MEVMWVGFMQADKMESSIVQLNVKVADPDPGIWSDLDLAFEKAWILYRFFMKVRSGS